MIGDWPQWNSGIHNVIHHGVIRDKNDLMSTLDECDVLLLPSLSEGMPTVILEAAARGLPAIASDVGAVSEVISQKGLTEPGNSEMLVTLIIQSQRIRLPHEFRRPNTWEEISGETYESLNQTSRV